MSVRNMGFKNTWGTPQSGIDQQRADLFYVTLNYPQVIGEQSTVFDQFISWTIEKFPFPDREIEAVAIKHGQQTNYQIGADKGLDGGIDITFRYAFNQRTAELLEKWFRLISNPITGGVGIASHVKTNGSFYWLVPDMNVQADLTNTQPDHTFVAGGAYYLEGAWLRSLKPSEANQTDGNKFVTLDCKLHIDRYYPINPSDLTVNYNATSVGSIGSIAIPQNLNTASQAIPSTF